jgi:hypothetical protein
VKAGPGVAHAARHAIKDLHAFDRIFTDSRLAAQHDGVGLFEDGICDVGDFRAGRKRFSIMDSSMCVAR